MPSLVFRLLVRVCLPRHRRDRYAGEMSHVFEELAVSTRQRAGRLGLGILLMRELGGLVRFSVRERLGRLADWQPFGEWRPLQELHWAWRGILARGWRAAFVVGLFGVVLAANTVVFSAADAFVFHTVPFPEAQRLAVIERVERDSTVSGYLPREIVDAWRTHADLFAGMHAHLRGASAYVTTGGVTEVVRAEAITPGLLELLGVVPAWGRPFVESDSAPGAPPVAIAGEALARRLFGSPQAAVGQPLPAGQDSPTIVGVMPASFRFPTAAEAIWRPFRLAPDPAERFPSNVRNLVRLAGGVSFDEVAAAVTTRSAAVGAARTPVQVGAQLVRRPMDPMRLRALSDTRRHEGAALIFAMLSGAAGCLLLIACANVASLEMAAASQRARAQAVRAALGASRASLVRTTWIESALLLVVSAAASVPLAIWGASAMSANLTASMREALVNPLDLDYRALAFMVAAAALAQAVVSAPAVRRLLRLSVADALRDDTRVMPVTRAAVRTRQFLMAGQIALTVLLLAGGLLYVRTYLARLGIERGLDDRGLVGIVISPASDAPRHGAELERAVLDALRANPTVRSVARSALIPPSTEAGISARLQVEGRPDTLERVMLASYSVDPEYFATVGVPVIEGRGFTSTSPKDEVLVNEAFARRFWPEGGAIGARFRMQDAGISSVYSFQIVGIARDVRQDRLVREGGENVFMLYIRVSPTYSPLSFIARLERAADLPAVAAVVRSIADRSVVRATAIADRYASLDGDRRLAASITSGFGILALVVATLGVYAVMAFLVAGRSREIGIRMALGADARAVQRLVFGSSLVHVGLGATLGSAAAVATSRWIESQLYGVSGTDVSSYAIVSGLVIVTALLATWLPARRAARVDPATTLRGD